MLKILIKSCITRTTFSKINKTKNKSHSTRSSLLIFSTCLIFVFYRKTKHPPNKQTSTLEHAPFQQEKTQRTINNQSLKTMATNQNPTSENQVFPEMPPIRVKPPSTSTASSPRVTVSTPTATATGAAVETPTAGAARKIAIAVDLSNESAFAVKWAVDHYIRPGDAVVLLHVRPTSVLYGADWGCVDFSASVDGNNNEESHQKLEDDFDAFTTSKASDLAQPLVQAQVKILLHFV